MAELPRLPALRRTIAQAFARPLSLTSKLVAIILATLAAALFLFGITTVVVMRTDLSQRLDGEVQQAAVRSLSYVHRGDHEERSIDRNPIDAPGQPTRALTLIADLTDEDVSGFYRSADGSVTALSAADAQLIAEAGLLQATFTQGSWAGSGDDDSSGYDQPQAARKPDFQTVDL